MNELQRSMRLELMAWFEKNSRVDCLLKSVSFGASRCDL